MGKFGISSSRSMGELLVRVSLVFSLALPGAFLSISPASSAPNSPAVSNKQQVTTIIKMLDGSTRMQIKLPRKLKGKQVVIQTSRIIDGTEWVTTLGRVKLDKKGRASITLSKDVQIQDRVLLLNKKKAVSSSLVESIQRETASLTPAPPSAGGSVSSSPQAPQSPREAAEAAARRYIESGGDPGMAAYINIINHLDGNGDYGTYEDLMENLQVVLDTPPDDTIIP
jgi:hypothetical protein